MTVPESSFDAWEVKTLVGSFFAIALISFLLASSGVLADQVGEPPSIGEETEEYTLDIGETVEIDDRDITLTQTDPVILDVNGTTLDPPGSAEGIQAQVVEGQTIQFTYQEELFRVKSGDFPQRPSDKNYEGSFQYNLTNFDYNTNYQFGSGSYVGDPFRKGLEIDYNERSYWVYYAPNGAVDYNSVSLNPNDNPPTNETDFLFFLAPEEEIQNYPRSGGGYSFVDWADENELVEIRSPDVGETDVVWYASNVNDGTASTELVLNDGSYYYQIEHSDGLGSLKYSQDDLSTDGLLGGVVAQISFLSQAVMWGFGYIFTLIVNILITIGSLVTFVGQFIFYIIYAWLNIGSLIPGVLGLLFQGFTIVLFLLLFNGIAKLIKMIPTT